MSCPEASAPEVGKVLVAGKQLSYAQIRSIMFDMMTDAEMARSSSFNAVNGRDFMNESMGLPNPSGECSSCGGSGIKQCDGHFGTIKLPTTIFHPFFVKEIAEILNQTCFMCKSPRQSMQGKSWCKISPKQSILNEQLRCKYCARKIYSKEWKFKVSREKASRGGIYVELKGGMLNKFKDKHTQIGDATGVMKFMLSPPQVFQLLKELERVVIERHVSRQELLFLSCFPIAPNCCRVTEARTNSSSVKVAFDDRTKAYKRLVNNPKCSTDARQLYSEVFHTALECLSLSKLHPKPSPSRATASSGLRWVKDVVLCKRTDHVFRMTVVGDPYIRLNELGIPADVSRHLTIPERITSHNEHIWNAQIEELKALDIYVRRNSTLCPLTDLDHLEIGDVLDRPLKDGDLLLVNRPPSVHQHSLIALSARILPTAAVFSMNPLCCAPFCGDFDGDCLHAYIPQSIQSRVELKELVHLGKQLINGQDGRSLISLSHDSLTAAHLLTGEMDFLSNSEIQQLQMPSMRSLPCPAIIKAPLLAAPLWTGRQLFSAILPDDLDFSVPSGKVIISKGELLVSPDESLWLENTADGLFSKISTCYGERALDYFSLAQEILCHWISMRGLSVSLEDMYVSSNSYDRKKLIQEVGEGLREAEHASCVNNLLMNAETIHGLRDCAKREEIHRMLNCKDKINSAAFKGVFDELQYLVRDFASKSNSMLSMIRAGSKGSFSKFLQQSACLGLQHSPASFKIPYGLSCADWNQFKLSDSHGFFRHASEHTRKHSSCAVIKSCFIDGLNPLEFFLHSLSGRANLFSENAEFPGTLTRKLMFFMRDIKVENDQTIRNSHGQQIINFSCDIPRKESALNTFGEVVVQGGHPVGALAACSISEAAYSSLELPSSNAQVSPLLSLKKAFECGQKKTASGQTVSLSLSQVLKKWDYGHEYAALKVKQHLERVLLSDVVSTVLIFYAGRDVKQGSSPWVTHFHVNEDRVVRKGLNAKMIGDALLREYKIFAESSSVMFPSLHMSPRCCLHDGVREEKVAENCITVAAENSKFPVDVDYVRNTLIPMLLRRVVKGFVEVKKAEIKWDDERSSGLCLKIAMSESCKAGSAWSFLQQACLPVMGLIDWHRSHPDNTYDVFKAYGVDAAWRFFVDNLKAATVKIGKRIHAEHLRLVANSLSVTGQFHPLSARGLKLQGPFLQGFFSAPEKSFRNAAKKCETDQLLGAVEAMAWGKEAPLGTGGPFELIWKAPDLGGQQSIYYPVLKTDCSLREGESAIPAASRLKASLKEILHRYREGARLEGEDKTLVAEALQFHPNRDAKIGVGIKEIRIGHNPSFPRSRCFVVERTDGTREDFSYAKCARRKRRVSAR